MIWILTETSNVQTKNKHRFLSEKLFGDKNSNAKHISSLRIYQFEDVSGVTGEKHTQLAAILGLTRESHPWHGQLWGESVPWPGDYSWIVQHANTSYQGASQQCIAMSAPQPAHCHTVRCSVFSKRRPREASRFKKCFCWWAHIARGWPHRLSLKGWRTNAQPL